MVGHRTLRDHVHSFDRSQLPVTEGCVSLYSQQRPLTTERMNESTSRFLRSSLVILYALKSLVGVQAVDRIISYGVLCIYRSTGNTVGLDMIYL